MVTFSDELIKIVYFVGDVVFKVKFDRVTLFALFNSINVINFVYSLFLMFMPVIIELSLP